MKTVLHFFVQPLSLCLSICWSLLQQCNVSSHNLLPSIPSAEEKKQLYSHSGWPDVALCYYIKAPVNGQPGLPFQETVPVCVLTKAGGGELTLENCLESRTFGNKHRSLIIKSNGSWGSLLRPRKSRAGAAQPWLLSLKREMFEEEHTGLREPGKRQESRR